MPKARLAAAQKKGKQPYQSVSVQELFFWSLLLFLLYSVFALWSSCASESNLRSSFSLHVVFACFLFHVVSKRSELVKLLALSNFQARRRSRGDLCFNGHFGQFYVIIIDIYVIDASLDARLLLQVSRHPITALRRNSSPFLCTVDDFSPEYSLLVFDSLDRRGEFVFDFVCFARFLWNWPLKTYLLFFLTMLDLSVSCRSSRLKGEPPRTRTLAAHRQKNILFYFGWKSGYQKLTLTTKKHREEFQHLRLVFASNCLVILPPQVGNIGAPSLCLASLPAISTPPLIVKKR